MATGTNKSKTRAPAKRVTREYTRAEKLAAVTAILTAAPDKPNGKRAIEAAKQTGVDVNPATLFDWVREYRTEVTALLPDPKTTQEIVLETRQSVLDQWAQVRQKALAALLDEDKIKNARYSDLNVAAGTAHDKIERAISALSPVETSAFLELNELAASRGQTALTLLKGMIALLKTQQARNVADILTNADGDERRAITSGESGSETER